MKTFLLYLFDNQLNDYQSLRIKLSHKETKMILRQTLAPEQWQYFLKHNQCYCNAKSLDLLGYFNPSSTHPPFIKQITPYDYPLFVCTFCFQTEYEIYFFDFKISQSQSKGRLKEILEKIQLYPYIPLEQEARDHLLSMIAPKKFTARCNNPQSIQVLIKKSHNVFICLKHNFKNIPHIRELINLNLCFEEPFFCYWFLSITNQDDNDTKACNVLLRKDVSSFCQKHKLNEDSCRILRHTEIPRFVNHEVFDIGKIEVVLSTYDY